MGCRYDITQLLLHLWGREDTKESIVKECSSRKFQVRCHMHGVVYGQVHSETMTQFSLE